MADTTSREDAAYGRAPRVLRTYNRIDKRLWRFFCNPVRMIAAALASSIRYFSWYRTMFYREEKAHHDLRLKVATLFSAIKHGDEKHQQWLEYAISNHFQGFPVSKE